jgi:membrane associated rhomboid family serine protease
MEISAEQRQADRLRLARAVLIATTALLFLWWVRAVEWVLDRPLSMLGVIPRDWGGLVGVLLAPLVHGSFEHLVANSLGVFLLTALAVYGYPRALAIALPSIWIGSGLGVWLFARDSVHLGASGLTHGLMFFLFALGLLRRDRLAIAVALIAFFLFGGMLMTIFPREPGVSWEYHLFGALSGSFAALLTRRLDPPPPEPRYSWDLEPEDEAVEASEAGDAGELEPPRPAEVPVLWQRPEPPRGVIVPFPRRNGDARDPGEGRP